MPANLADDLRAARALIDTPEKWRKDSARYQSGCCAAIAVARISNRNLGGGGEGWAALYAELPDAYKKARDSDDYGVCIGRYNDNPSTTHADILALFDRAIARAQSHGDENV